LTSGLLPDSGSPFERRRTGVGPVLLFLIVVVFLFSLGLFVVWPQLRPAHSDETANPAVEPLPAVHQFDNTDVDDVDAHLRNAIEDYGSAAVQLKKAK